MESGAPTSGTTVGWTESRLRTSLSAGAPTSPTLGPGSQGTVVGAPECLGPEPRADRGSHWCSGRPSAAGGSGTGTKEKVGASPRTGPPKRFGVTRSEGRAREKRVRFGLRGEVERTGTLRPPKKVSGAQESMYRRQRRLSRQKVNTSASQTSLRAVGAGSMGHPFTVTLPRR